MELKSKRYFRGRCEREILSFGDGNGEFIEQSNGERNDVAHTITNDDKARGSYVITPSEDNGIMQLNDPTHSNNRVYAEGGTRPALNTAQGGNRQPFVLQVNPSTESGGKQPYQQNRIYDTEGVAPANNAQLSSGSIAIPVLTPNRPTKRQNGRRFKAEGDEDQHGVMVQAVSAKQQGKPRVSSESFACLGANDYKEPQSVALGNRIRGLTPVECERLQGCPDGFTQYGRYGDEIKEMSDTARYKGLGNSFTVNVIEAIVTRMIEKGCLK